MHAVRRTDAGDDVIACLQTPRAAVNSSAVERDGVRKRMRSLASIQADGVCKRVLMCLQTQPEKFVHSLHTTGFNVGPPPGAFANTSGGICKHIRCVCKRNPKVSVCKTDWMCLQTP